MSTNAKYNAYLQQIEALGKEDPAAKYAAQIEAMPVPDPKEAAYARLNARGGNKYTDFLRVAGNTAALPLKVAGAMALKGPASILDALKPSQNVEDLRLLAPGASAAASAAGGMLLPTGTAGLLPSTAGRLAKTAVGAGVGGVQGGLLGYSEGGTGEAIKQGLLGGILNSAPYAIPGILGVGKRLFANTGKNVAKGLEEATGLSAKISEARQSATAALKTAAEEGYQKLDALGPIDNARINELIRSPDFLNYTRAVGKDLVAGGTKKAPTAARAPVWDELKQLRSTLRGGDARERALGNQLNKVLQEEFGETLTNADKLYAQGNATNKLLNAGKSAAGKDEDAILQTMKKAGVKTAEDRQIFNQGQLYKHIEQLTTKGDEATGQLRKFLDMGESTRKSIRTMFEPGAAGDAAMAEFEKLVRSEASADKISRFIKAKWWVPIPIGGALYGTAKLRDF